MSHPRGVRTRLLGVVIVSVAVALALMTVGFNVLLARSLNRDADSVVKTRAETEAASVEVARNKLVAPDQPDIGGLETQAWVYRADRALEAPTVSAALARAAQSAAREPGAVLDVPSEHTRLYATRASDYANVVVVAGVWLGPYERTQRIALVGSVVFACVLLLVVVFVARWMLRAALRPVSVMTADAEMWSERDLDRRFHAGEPYDELSQLAATLDGLLDRLSASLRREQRFSAEVSHELRTPLTKVRAEAQLALRRERAPEEYRQALGTIASNAKEMTATIETLVAAAQQESGLARGHCDVRVVIEALLEGAHGGNSEREVRLEAPALDARLEIGVEADVATRVLQPIVENARRLAASTVRVSPRRVEGGVDIHVDDDGPGVREDESELIFEPGVRGSANADSAHPGAGLGLALARRLARAAGGDITVRPATDGGHFTVHLPAG
jgi:signal transduction histidine kinase